MARRQGRRQDERRAQAERRRSEPKEPGSFLSRLSTDWIVGGLIASVMVIAALAFTLRVVLSNSGGQDLIFNQVFSVAADPADQDLLLLGDANGLFRSDNGGDRWRETDVDEDIRSIFAVGPGSYLAAGGEVLLRSGDQGLTWQALPNNLPSLELRSLAADPANAPTMYTFAAGHGLFRSDDNGSAWRLVSPETQFIMASLAVAPGDPDTIFAFHTERGLIVSHDGGEAFEPVRGGIPFLAVADLLTVAEAPETVYAVAQGSFWKSEDGGENWKVVTAGLDQVQAAAVTKGASPDSLVLTDAFGFVYTSANGGESWVTRSR